MTRMLCLVAIVLTANQVSAQQIKERPAQTTTHTTIYLDPSAPIVVESINFPYTELTEVRLWAPSKKTGEYRWWQLTREHRGPSWERSGLLLKRIDDVVVERWVPGEAPLKLVAEERQRSGVIQHSTKCYWPEEDLKESKQEPRPKRLVEPVYRVPKPLQAEEKGDQWRPLEVQPPTQRQEPAPERKPVPKEELDEPTGPTFLVKRSSERK